MQLFSKYFFDFLLTVLTYEIKNFFILFKVKYFILIYQTFFVKFFIVVFNVQLLLFCKAKYLKSIKQIFFVKFFFCSVVALVTLLLITLKERFCICLFVLLACLTVLQI